VFFHCKISFLAFFLGELAAANVFLDNVTYDNVYRRYPSLNCSSTVWTGGIFASFELGKPAPAAISTETVTTTQTARVDEDVETDVAAQTAVVRQVKLHHSSNLAQPELKPLSEIRHRRPLFPAVRQRLTPPLVRKESHATVATRLSPPFRFT
jgi:hypothetical protein